MHELLAPKVMYSIHNPTEQQPLGWLNHQKENITVVHFRSRHTDRTAN